MGFLVWVAEMVRTNALRSIVQKKKLSRRFCGNHRNDTKMMESSSKRRGAEENNVEGMDRMSSLPDSVLCHILSFLPTKTCVATMSLVSRRWRYLWEHLQVFDFSDDSHEHGLLELFKSFAFFVNAVLTLRRSRDVRKMHLYCGISDEDTFPNYSIDTWLRAAFGPRLEELSLNISDDCGCGFVVLPPTLLSCTNLVSLSLSGAIHVHVQHSSAVVHFPSLKTLHLDILFMDSIDALLSACPILETLQILDAPDSMSKFRVPPSTKRLNFTDLDHHIRTYLEIDAPGLQYLSITTSGTFDAAVGNLQNVVEAYIDVASPSESEFVNPLLNLLRALSGTKHLALSPLTTKWLLCAPVLDFPEFRYLLHLNLNLPCFNSNLLVNVLEKCHMLQVIIIQSDKEASPLRTWEPQSTRVPNCLVSHLTFIDIIGYQGFEDELAFAEYILRNGLVLKRMIIIADFSLDLKKKHCILKRLSEIPRGSVMCQLKFD